MFMAPESAVEETCELVNWEWAGPKARPLSVLTIPVIPMTSV